MQVDGIREESMIHNEMLYFTNASEIEASRSIARATR